MQRSLKRSNRHFQKAVKRLPAGVSSNFCCRGEDKTIYDAMVVNIIVTKLKNNTASA